RPGGAPEERSHQGAADGAPRGGRGSAGTARPAPGERMNPVASPPAVTGGLDGRASGGLYARRDQPSGSPSRRHEAGPSHTCPSCSVITSPVTMRTWPAGKERFQEASLTEEMPRMQFYFFHLMPWPYLPDDFDQK